MNVDCLDTESIQSLEVTYYEDLLGFPPDECAGNDTSKPTSSAPVPPTSTSSSAKSSSMRGADKENDLVLVPISR